MRDGTASARALRLLIVGLNYAPEPVGIGPYTAGLAEFLAARGHSVSVVAGRPYYPQWRVPPAYRRLAWRRSRENGVSIVRCPHYVPAQPTGVRRILHHLSFAAAALGPALGAARRERSDAVLCIAPSLLSVPVAKAAALAAGAPLWLHIQDFEVDAAQATGLVGGGGRAARALARLERAWLRWANMVSTISPQMVTRLQAKGVPAERTAELRNWAAPPALAASGAASGAEPFRRAWGLEGKTVALYSGTLARKQGVGILAEAARCLGARPDIAFVVCGEGPEGPALAAASRGLPNLQLHPLQPAERLAELLAIADVHVLPQVTAAADLVLPSKLTNMLQSGRPVVATAEPGTGLADEVAGCGLIVPPGDAAALAAAVARLADDADLRASLGETARQRAAERWSQDAILGTFAARLTAFAQQRKPLASAPSQP